MKRFFVLYSNLFILKITLSSVINDKILSHYSIITLKINLKRDTECDVINGPMPNEIFINGIEQVEIDKKYNLKASGYIIKLVWHSDLNSCNEMFKDCEDINEIDLSNFNSKSITSLSSMFKGCKSLSSINFTNFVTSKVMNMDNMFSDCSSLKSIDLSYFDTSQVTNMDHMFSTCKTLTSLDLSNFDTSLVTDMEKMFYN